MATWIIGIIVFGAVAGAGYSVYKSRGGGGSCGCGCEGCAKSGQCHE
jgi:hypothetical protein